MSKRDAGQQATLHIRQATPADAEALRSCSWPGDTAALPASIIAGCLDAGSSFVALAGDAIAGYLLTQPLAYDGAQPLTLWVEAVGVQPASRRRGIATALYRALGDWAGARRVKGIVARVTPAEAAAWALHRRVGFEPHRDDLVIWRVSEA